MKRYLFLLILVSWSAIAGEELRVVISHYPPYVDKTRIDLGIYPRFLKRFFEEENIKYKFSFMPYARSLYALDKNLVDMAILGKSSLEGNKKKILISDQFYKVRFCLFRDIKKNKSLHYKEVKDLKKYKVVSIIKSPLNAMLDKAQIKYNEVPHFESALNMIVSGRVDVFPTSYAIANEHINKNKIKYENIKCDIDIRQEPLVIGLSNKPKHKKILIKLNKFFSKNKIKLIYE